MRMPVTNNSTSPAPLSPFTTGPGVLAPAPYAYGAGAVGGLSPATAGPTLGGLLNALKRRWVLASFAGLVVATAAAAVTLVSLPSGKHVAKTTLWATRPITGTDENYRSFKEQLFNRLRSRNVVNLMLNQVDVS